MPVVTWNKPEPRTITWEKPRQKTRIRWDKPLKPTITWEKPTRGGIDWEGTETNAFARMSKFGKVLDILGRPSYAVKAAISQSQREAQEATKDIPQGESPDLKWARTVAVMKKKPQIKKRFQAAWRGLTGKERHTANELWKNVGVEGVPFLGFATELISDPMMYGGYQAITKAAGKAVGVTAKVVRKVPIVEKAVTKVGIKVQPVATHLKEMFVTKTGIKKLNDLIETHLGKREYLKLREQRFGIKTRNVIQNISKKYGQSIDDVERQIVSLIEQPQVTIPGIAPETQALSNTIKSHLTNILTTEMKAGVPITALSQGKRGIQYFPRITTREATQYLKQARIGNRKIWNVRLANALRRKTGDFTLEEFNVFAREHGLQSLGGKSVEQFFMKNPAYAVATRGIRSAKAVTSAQFLDDVGRTFGTTAEKAPAFYQELPDTVTRLMPRLKGLRFDPEVAGEVTRTTTTYFNPNEIRGFLRGWDAVHNVWKKWTLAPFPKYHLRNMVGNVWNNYLAGVTDPKQYGKAQAIQMYRKYKATTGRLNQMSLKNLQTFGLSPQTADDIILRAEQTGVLGRGWYAADIETGIQMKARKGLIERGMAFGTTIENNARLAHFITKVDKGYDTLSAAKSVKKFLFDYGDLTGFEKKVMKRLLPFYTWTRKNVPLQLEHIWKQPQKYAPIAIPLRMRDPKDLLRLKYARPDLYERLPVEMRRDIDTVTYVPLEGLIPAGDLAKIIRPQEIFTELLSPILRAPIELLMNKTFYFESEIQRYDEETQELLRTDTPVRIKYLLTTVLPQARMLNEINKLVKKQVRKQTLTPAEQAFSQSLSSIYKVNIKDLRDRALRRIQDKVKDLQSGMFWAKRNKRPKEEKRIRETYQQLKQMIKQLK